MELRLKSARTPAAASDGARLLVDRLWPRGMSKAKLSLTDWPKAIAPSNELRRRVRRLRQQYAHSCVPRASDAASTIRPRLAQGAHACFNTAAGMATSRRGGLSSSAGIAPSLTPTTRR